MSPHVKTFIRLRVNYGNFLKIIDVFTVNYSSEKSKKK